MNTSCNACGTIYNPLESEAVNYQQYCSTACEQKNEAACQHCQKAYVVNDSNAYHKERYCSEVCEDHDHLVCERCAVTYSSNVSDAYNDVTYCSKACEDGVVSEAEAQCTICNRYYEEQTSSAKAKHLFCDFLCEERAFDEGKAIRDVEQAEETVTEVKEQPIAEQVVEELPKPQVQQETPMEKLDRVAKTLEEQNPQPISPVKEFDTPQIPINRQPKQEKVKKGLFGKKPTSYAQNHGANGEPKLSGRALRNEWYNYKAKRFLVTWIIFTVVYLYFMRDFTTIPNSFQQSTGTGILYVVLLAASFIFAFRALFKVLRGILLGPIKRFKSYVAIVITFIVICVLQQVFLGSVFAIDAVFDSIEFGKTTNDFIQDVLPWIQSFM